MTDLMSGAALLSSSAFTSFVVNCVNDLPQLIRCDSNTGNHWIKVKTIGTKSNRSGIGARIK